MEAPAPTRTLQRYLRPQLRLQPAARRCGVPAHPQPGRSVPALEHKAKGCHCSLLAGRPHRIEVYALPHLDRAARSSDYPQIEHQSTRYRFIPTSLLLMDAPSGGEARFYKNQDVQARELLEQLKLTDKSIQDLTAALKHLGWVKACQGDPKKLRWYFQHALNQGEIAVVTSIPTQAPPPREAEPEMVPATGVGESACYVRAACEK